LSGRAHELKTLSATIRKTHPTRIALIGSGGSGKSVLAAALAHRVRPHFAGGLHWFRVGNWDFRTLSEMMALSFKSELGDARVEKLRARLADGKARLIVLDNHENDAAVAELLEAFAKTQASFVITARRCLLSGVLLFPVTAPLVTSGASAFPRVATLTRLLRWNPLALDIADRMVRSRAIGARELADFLETHGASHVRAIEHEDDLPEVRLLVDWCFERLSAASRRLLAALAHLEGDHADLESLARLARVGKGAESALLALQRWHLVQEPLRGRYALHAVVRHAVSKRTSLPAPRLFEHYVRLLERHPERLRLEQTHLFGAMDHAHRTNDLRAMLRVEALLEKLAEDYEERLTQPRL
jgi:hypothetical protein